MKKEEPDDKKWILEKLYSSVMDNPSFWNKLKCGLNILTLRYQYSGYYFDYRLLILPVYFLPILLLVILPYYIFIQKLQLEFLNLIIPILTIPAIALGIIFVLLLANYCFVNGYEM